MSVNEINATGSRQTDIQSMAQVWEESNLKHQTQLTVWGMKIASDKKMFIGKHP
jgi:hypothetical protein